jgi:predicted NBD/HSP70 family sugar kinase
MEGGEMCSCGNKGCWEVYASDRATIRRYLGDKNLSADQGSRITISDVIDLAKKGDGPAREAMTKTAQYIGLGIAGIIRAFDPEVIVIGGLITQYWELVYPHIMETVNRRGFLGMQRNTTIIPTSLSENPPLLGAAALSIRKIFADYRIAI